MRPIVRLALLSCAVLVAAVAGTAAQGTPPQGGRGPQPPPKNLQVLPKDWTTQQVTMLMRTFTVGLGVQCDHCHVSQQDRASDEKKPKLVARKMLAMMLAINDQYLKDVGDPLPPTAPPAPPAMKVTCYTCHRGALKPLTAAPAGGH
jgi:hypothetical protein